MDARDLMPLSLSSSAPSRDGPTEDDAMIVGLTKDAALLFQSRRYGECVEVLNQLLQKRKQSSKDEGKEDDPKILHNIAVTEYFCDGGSDPRRLLDELDKAKKKIEELARTVGAPLEIVGSPGSNIISESRGSSTTQLQLSYANAGSVTFADEFDSSVVTFNIAVVLYHLHEYKHALSVLLPLYQNIEPIDEPLALHICLLLLDVALASHDASRAADVIQYLEKKSSGGGYKMNQFHNRSSSQLHSSSQGLTIPSNIVAQENSSSDSSASANVLENPLVGASSDDALEFENLYSTLDGGGPNFGRLTSNDHSKTPPDWVAPAFDLNLKIRLYKVRFLLLTKNQKATKREVKLAMTDVRGRDSSAELILKTQVEYERCNYSKSIKLLQACSNRTEPAMQIIFDNNLGCIYHQLGKHNLSHLLFVRALRAGAKQLSEKPQKLLGFWQNKSHYIMYNCGLESLSCGRPLPAAHAFHQAALCFDDRPLFWLRSAECCLLALKNRPREEINVQVVGSGRWRKLVVEDSGLRNGFRALTPQDRRLSLPFARECLGKALILSDNLEANVAVSASEESQVSEESKETILQSSVAAYTDMCRRENHIIRQAVLVDLAYVELCLDNPLKALNAARLLQQLSDCSRMYSFLSRVYAAEALCHLNRLKEAMEELSFCMKDDSRVDLPYSEDDLKLSTVRHIEGEESKGGGGASGWASLRPEEARGVLYANLAAMSAMNGDLEAAVRLTKESLYYLPENPRAMLASIYVDLKQGKPEAAVAKLRHSRHVRFLSTRA